jgi:glycosyltransferase involved in cell wall biosynthesis
MVANEFIREIGRYDKFPHDDKRVFEGGKRLGGRHNKKDARNNPLVTIITVVYNNEKTIERCMKSVFKQTYDNLEYIIIDGASTDNTLSLVKNSIEKIDYVISEPDRGIYHAMNKGLSLASGEYIAMINSDDWLEPDGIMNSVSNIMKNHADVSIGYANVWDRNDKFSHVWTIGNFDARILLSGMSFCHQAVVASKKAYLKTGLYDEKIKISSDYKWVKELYLKSLNFVFTELPVVNFSFDGMAAHNRPIWKEECKQMVCDSFGVDYKLISPFLEYVYRDQKLEPISAGKLIESASHDNLFLHSISMVMLDKLAAAEKVGSLPCLKASKERNATKEQMVISPKISVIIPVYNVEEYLEECVRSVMNQSLKDIEIILVNDGSPDGCPKIMDKLAAEDERIRIINQENSGLSAARNAGYRSSNGEYVHFLDSDDYIKDGMYQEMYEYATKNDLDLVKSNLGFIDDVYPTKIPPSPSKKIFSYKDCPEYFRFVSPCASLYKRTLLEKTDLFPIDMTYEDRPFNWQTIIFSKKIGNVNKIYYMYRASRPGSIMSSRDGNVKHFEAFKAIDLIKSFLLKYSLMDGLKIEYVKEQLRVFSMLIDIYAIPKKQYGRFLIECKKRINEYPVSIRDIVSAQLPERVKNLYCYLLEELKSPNEKKIAGARYFHNKVDLSTSDVSCRKKDEMSSCQATQFCLKNVERIYCKKKRNEETAFKLSVVESLLFDYIHFQNDPISETILEDKISRIVDIVDNSHYFNRLVKRILSIESNSINTIKHLCFNHSKTQNYISIKRLLDEYFVSIPWSIHIFTHSDLPFIEDVLNDELKKELYGKVLSEFKNIGLRTYSISQQISAFIYLRDKINYKNLETFSVLFPFSPIERLISRLVEMTECKTVFIPHGLAQRSFHGLPFDYVIPPTMTSEWRAIYPTSQHAHIGWIEAQEANKIVKHDNKITSNNKLKMRTRITFLSQINGAKIHRLPDLIEVAEFFISNVLALENEAYEFDIRLRNESEKELLNGKLVKKADSCENIIFSTMSDVPLSMIETDLLVGASSTGLLYSCFLKVPSIQLTTSRIQDHWPFILSADSSHYVIDSEIRDFSDVLLETLKKKPMRLLYREPSKKSVFAIFDYIYKAIPLAN